MNIDGTHYRTIWVKPDDPSTVQIIDQQLLPHQFVVRDLRTVEDFARAIRDMLVRGAGLIGATAGFGMYAAARQAPAAQFDEYVREAGSRLIATRPTAKNLEWAVRRQLEAMAAATEVSEKIELAFQTGQTIADEDAEFCRHIGEHGKAILQAIAEAKPGKTVNILTHCNAGWLAFVDYGSATSPIYAAHDAGIPVHVFIDETRPRNQGASLTAWELGKHGVSHDIVVDNAGGHLMQHGLVDAVIVGSDRTTVTGDVANKIGTYLKALAARDNGVPFYVALPSSTFDWELTDGVEQIPIEERNPHEVLYVGGYLDGARREVRICPEGATARNYGFDVTPSRLVTGLITERGVCRAERESILTLYPEKRAWTKAT
jgi:methylthioribose-1-phosphate isomerase